MHFPSKIHKGGLILNHVCRKFLENIYISHTPKPPSWLIIFCRFAGQSAIIFGDPSPLRAPLHLLLAGCKCCKCRRSSEGANRYLVPSRFNHRFVHQCRSSVFRHPLVIRWQTSTCDDHLQCLLEVAVVADHLLDHRSSPFLLHSY